MAPIPDRDYNHLVAQIQHQQRHIAALEVENRELQRRLGELRRGIGISVTVQGQTMSLTSPIATVVSQSTEPADPGITGIFPVILNSTLAGTAGPSDQPMPPRSSRPHSQPAPHYGTAKGPLAQGAWETGAWPERGAHVASQPQHARGAGTWPTSPRWLQDEAPEWPSLATPYGQERRSPPVSHPIAPTPKPVESEQFSTLAKLTGHHPAIRLGKDQRQHPHDPNPYSDSFVLG